MHAPKNNQSGVSRSSSPLNSAAWQASHTTDAAAQCTHLALRKRGLETVKAKVGFSGDGPRLVR